jgi:hypothetical protein
VGFFIWLSSTRKSTLPEWADCHSLFDSAPARAEAGWALH